MEYLKVRILKPHWMFPYPLGSIVTLEEEDATMLINDGCARLAGEVPADPDPRTMEAPEEVIESDSKKEKWWKRLFRYLRQQRARLSAWLIKGLQEYADEL